MPDHPLSSRERSGSSSDAEVTSPAVLLCGFSPDEAAALTTRLQQSATVLDATDLAQVMQQLAAQEIAVLCVGGLIAGKAAAELLSRIVVDFPAADRCQVVLAAGPELELFQELVDEDQLYYLSQQPPPLEDVSRILGSAVQRHRERARSATLTEMEPSGVQSILEIAQHLARETTLERAAALAAQAVEQVLECDRAFCLVYDPHSDTLWAPPPALGGDREERRESAAAGLVSFVVRTGTPVLLEHVGSDPRYDPDADTDRGAPDQRFLAVPVSTGSAARKPLAVLVALRDAAHPPFTDRQLRSLQLLAEQMAATFDRFALRQQLERSAAERHGAEGSVAAAVFRSEAVQHHVRGFHEQGHLLRLSPAWTRWAYYLLLAVFAGALLFASFASIHEYAPGVAVVRVEGRFEINARQAGTVTAVEVGPGEKVSAGQLLVRFYDAQEAAELERITRDFEMGLLDRLRNPVDRSNERALSALRAQKELAEKRLEERSVRAPMAGVIGDIRVREGQHLLAGQGVLSLISENAQPTVVSLFPGHYRPLIEVGMPMRLELHGYQYAYQHLVVDTIGEEVVGPNEARRMLGAGIADALPLSGPVVFVSSRLPSRSFTSGGSTYEYHDGMQGLAEVRIRSESIITTLIPGLKALIDGPTD